MRRTVTLVIGQSDAKRSKAKLWAFGLGALAAAVGLHESTVRRHVAEGALNPCDLLSVAEWLRRHQQQS